MKWEPFAQIRRNHALEHATIHILSQKDPQRALAGYSDAGGFWVLGNVTLEELQQAVDEAQTRLRAGEANLSIHPNCGTNFATAGVMAGSLAWLGMLGSGSGARQKFDRLPVAILLSTLGLIASRPLGPMIQARFTTDSDLGSLRVAEIIDHSKKGKVVHRVVTHF